MNHSNARIVGTVVYRQGDGPSAVIPPGPIDVEKTELDVTLSWADGDTRHSAAMPLDDFERYAREGAISEIAPPAGRR